MATKTKGTKPAARSIVTFWVDAELLKEIDREKTRENRSRANMIEQILRRYFAGEVRKNADASAAG